MAIGSSLRLYLESHITVEVPPSLLYVQMKMLQDEEFCVHFRNLSASQRVYEGLNGT